MPDGPASIVVSGGVVSTVQVRLAGLGSVLPAGSVARTVNVCEPSARPLYVWGEVHAVKRSAVERAAEGRAGLGSR